LCEPKRGNNKVCTRKRKGRKCFRSKKACKLSLEDSAEPSEEPVDCDACANEFLNADGCKCLASMIEGCDVMSYIPEGCDSCHKETDAVCMQWYKEFMANSEGGDCGECMEKFAAADGCECMGDKDCDLAGVIPDGCQHCGADADQFCADYMNTEESTDEPIEELPSCTCPSYETGAVSGTEMCQFGKNCALASGFKSGCPDNSIHCAHAIGTNVSGVTQTAGADVRRKVKVCWKDHCKGNRRNPVPMGQVWIDLGQASVRGCCDYRKDKCHWCAPPLPTNNGFKSLLYSASAAFDDRIVLLLAVVGVFSTILYVAQYTRKKFTQDEWTPIFTQEA